MSVERGVPGASSPASIALRISALLYTRMGALSAMQVKLTKRGMITLPKDLRAGLPDGATMDVVLRDDGVLELRPEAGADGSQAWFWSPRWQQIEREADEDFAAGRYDTFADAEDFLSDVDAHVGAGDAKTVPYPR